MVGSIHKLELARNKAKTRDRECGYCSNFGECKKDQTPELIAIVKQPSNGSTTQWVLDVFD